MVHHDPARDTQDGFKEARRRVLESFERTYLIELTARYDTIAAMSRACGVTRKHIRSLLIKYGLRDPASAV